jgi:hypothetical protein
MEIKEIAYQSLFNNLSKNDTQNVFTPPRLIRRMLSRLKFDSDGTVLVWYNVEFLVYLVKEVGLNPKNIYIYTNTEDKLILEKKGYNVFYQDIIDFDKINSQFKKMKFDVVLGNPPFQDGTKKGGQNKIYLDITKQSLSLLKDNGIICFITPTSILKKTKRFSLVGIKGLKFVNFNTDDYFKQGIKICSWMVDKKYEGDINVIIKDKIIQSPKGEMIYNFIENEGNFFKIYQKLKEITKSPKDRMFLQNPVDTKTGRKFVQDEIFQYPVHKIQKGEKIVVQYNKPTPKLYGQNKFIIPITKGFLEESTFTDIDDYDVAHLFLKINNDEELNNVKSFIFSKYFIEHVSKWKKMDGYGYNYALKHLPKFNINKHWTSEEVKTFIESYIE